MFEKFRARRGAPARFEAVSQRAQRRPDLSVAGDSARIEDPGRTQPPDV